MSNYNSTDSLGQFTLRHYDSGGSAYALVNSTGINANYPLPSENSITVSADWLSAEEDGSDLHSGLVQLFVPGYWRITGSRPGDRGTFYVNSRCTVSSSSGVIPPQTVSRRDEFFFEHPVTLSVTAPKVVTFGSVLLGQKKSVDLPIQVTSDGPASYDLFLRADKPQIGGTGLIGSGSYRIDLPADLGGGSADLSGTTGIPVVAAGEGITTINSNITLSVPDNADVGDHSANLTVTIRQK
ncbi:hypothetical protein [Aeromonas veronii]|uniref:hypothetical protein n=1 Tax=Aeromonas veronii TaxID=654 RepID=UPI003B9FD4DA